MPPTVTKVLGGFSQSLQGTTMVAFLHILNSLFTVILLFVGFEVFTAVVMKSILLFGAIQCVPGGSG
jgi:hypothetical protein